MPDITALKKSTFVTKSDLGQNGSLFTIISCEQVNTAKEGAPPEMKWALNFEEIDKPFILNSTNAQIIAQFTGASNTDNWTGKKVVLFFDPSVSYAGKLVGGIRARAPRSPIATAANASKPTPVAPAPDEDVPF
jgi:hypothetical protein